MKYQVFDHLENKMIGRVYVALEKAARYADILNYEYGSVRYYPRGIKY